MHPSRRNLFASELALLLTGQRKSIQSGHLTLGVTGAGMRGTTGAEKRRCCSGLRSTRWLESIFSHTEVRRDTVYKDRYFSDRLFHGAQDNLDIECRQISVSIFWISERFRIRIYSTEVCDQASRMQHLIVVGHTWRYVLQQLTADSPQSIDSMCLWKGFVPPHEHTTVSN